MVCSEKELGLSDEHEGILVLPDDAPVGMPLMEYFGDTVIEFEITPNLAHNFSINGIAREVHALLDRPITPPSLFDLAAIPPAPDETIRIQDADRCSRYMVLVIENVIVQPSPLWLARRLEAAGMRSINTVVDITNVVMHELGNPVHAFDRDKLAGGRVHVRAANPGETIETLDHARRSLTPAMTVIADDERPVALAGIMGGFDSEISNETTRLLVEVANFSPTITRETSRALKLRTDASGRYERGVDSEGIPSAVARLAQLVHELCPGATFTGIADAFPAPVQRAPISFPFDRVSRLLGIEVDPGEALQILQRLGFLAAISGGNLTVTPPSWRPDVTQREDVIEEIARIAGYERLPATLPSGSTQPVRRDPMYRLRVSARAALVSQGFNEAVSYLTLDAPEIALFSNGASTGVVVEAHTEWLLRLRNALQADRNILRPTLIPSLLHTLSANLRHDPTVRLAEFARIYIPSDGDILPTEVEVAGIVMAGNRNPVGLDVPTEAIDFRDLKGAVEAVLATLGAPQTETKRWQHPAFHPGRTAEIMVGGQTVARLGEIHPETARAFGVEDIRVLAAEINLSLLLAIIPGRGRDAVVPRSLPVRQDFAVVVDDTVTAAEIESAFRQGAGPLLTDITLFDRFTGPQIGEGKASLAWRLTFTAPDRTLTDDDLVRVRPKIEKSLKQRVNGVLRG